MKISLTCDVLVDNLCRFKIDCASLTLQFSFLRMRVGVII